MNTSLYLGAWPRMKSRRCVAGRNPSVAVEKSLGDLLCERLIETRHEKKGEQ